MVVLTVLGIVVTIAVPILASFRGMAEEEFVMLVEKLMRESIPYI